MDIEITTYRLESKQQLLTNEIQDAINRVSISGGGKVVIAPGTYRCGTLYLKDHVTLALSEGAILVGSRDLRQYPMPDDAFCDAVGDVRGRAFIVSEGTTGAALIGPGVIDGNGGAFPQHEPGYKERPFLLRVHKSRQFTIKNISLRNSAAWTCHLLDCDEVTVQEVRIDSRINENNDGIDIDSCRDVNVMQCKVESDDDAICIKSTQSSPCENIEVKDCVLVTECSAIKIGTESYGDVRHVNIHHCRIPYAATGAIKILSSDGATIEDINISNIDIEKGTGPIFIRLGERSRTYTTSDQPKKAGQIRDIKFDKINASVFCPPKDIENPFTGEVMPSRSFSGIFITGLPDKCVENIALSNLSIQFYGQGRRDDIGRLLPQHRDMYPELFYFGPLPSYGVYLRHTKNISFDDIDFSLLHDDPRPMFAETDTLNSTFNLRRSS